MDEAAVRAAADDSADLQRRYFAANAALILGVGQRIADALRAGSKVLTFGNGGSAADAQHFAAELVGRYLKDRAAWPAIALTTDTSILTAVANDIGYDAVFRRQVEALGRKGDVAVGISTSGRSPSVVTALAKAREMGLVTIGMTGHGGGKLAGQVDYLIDVPSPATPRIQEVHGLVIHVLCAIVEEAIAG
ncbi:MAG TPA: D-sedoheptulose 7-phosphate isomerase [Vicinamibacteria bacterium]|jgi:D-sedoheptulose 7-phosphate isomerase